MQHSDFILQNMSPLKKRLLGLVFCLLCFGNTYAANFSHSPLSPQYKGELQDAGLWHKNCPVSLERLRDVQISYYDFSGSVHHDGHLIVLDTVADDVIKAFKKLYRLHFPINKIVPTSAYNGDDKLSLKDNNTSSFNCREITGGGPPSIHSYGLAIDINTIQNPYISISEDDGVATISPAAGAEFINRHNIRPGMVEPIVRIFQQSGFSIWGGNWNTPIDYQHFQSTRFVAKMLASLPEDDAKEFYAITKLHYDSMKKIEPKYYDSIWSLYQRDPKKFFKVFKRHAGYLLTHDANQFVEKITSKLS